MAKALKSKAQIAALFLLSSLALPMMSAQDAPAPPQTDEPQAVPDQPEGDLPEPATAAALKLLALVQALDEEAEFSPNGATFKLADTALTLVFDVNADRMRLVSAIGTEGGLSEAQLRRLMQANFDSALDARYAIAQGLIWSTFIHPLSSLTQEDFISGIAQTVSLAQTYGTTFSSGAVVFGGGDSSEELQELLDSLLDKSREI